MAIRSLNEKNNGILEFGLIIGDKNARAMGLGAEVYILLLEYAFSSPKITRINATTAADNVIACRTLKSIGFVKESVKKMGFLLNNNEKCDAINYRILSSEWSQKREKVKHLIMHMKITNLNK